MRKVKIALGFGNFSLPSTVARVLY